MSLKSYLHKFDEPKSNKIKTTDKSEMKRRATAPPGPNGFPKKSAHVPGQSDSAASQNRLHHGEGAIKEPAPTARMTSGNSHPEYQDTGSEYTPISESELESIDTKFESRTRNIVRTTRPKGYEELKSALRVELLNVLNLAELDSMAISDREVLVRQVVEDLPGLKEAPLNKRERSQIIRELMDEVFGFGPLEPLLADSTITEILVNGHDKVYVERGGILELSNVTFKDDEHVMLIANRIVGPLGRHIDDSSPMCDARLPDGSRVNIIIPPLATDGPCITIRRFTSMPTSINKLIEYGSIPSRLAVVLLACVKAKLNIIISGGTGTGKCITGDTPVVLSSGRILQIKDLVEETFSRQRVTTDRDNWSVSPGDRSVLTYDPEEGNFKHAKIAQVWRHEAPKTLISITTRSGKQITVTPEHPFFTRDTVQAGTAKLESKRMMQIRADQLQRGMRIATPSHLPICQCSTNEMREEFKKFADLSNANMSIPHTPSLEMMRFLGLVIGNAHLREEYVEFSVPAMKKQRSMEAWERGSGGEIPCTPAPLPLSLLGELKEGKQLLYDFLNLGTSLFGVNGEVKESSPKTLRARIYSATLVKMLNQIFSIPIGNSPAKTRIADWIFTLPDEHIRALLDGLFDCNASVIVRAPEDKRSANGEHRVAISYSTVSAELANDVSYLLQRLGIASRLCERKGHYCITFHGADMNRRSCVPASSCKAVAPILWDEVKKVTHLTNHGEKYVYDLTVDGTHTFIAGRGGGIVTHNTTLLNVLSSAIPENERIVTIEDVAELQLQQEHVVRLEARQANIEGKGEITLRQLVKNSLRMRPDRIIVGEVRSGEAFDMLQAMSTGHDGSLATVHANTPRDALSRIGMLILMADLNLPETAIRQYISRALDVVVQIRRLRDGSRKIVSIAEITGMEGEVISMQELFAFREVGMSKDGKVIGNWRGSGVRPNFMDRIDAAGIKLPSDIFSERVIPC